MVEVNCIMRLEARVGTCKQYIPSRLKVNNLRLHWQEETTSGYGDYMAFHYLKQVTAVQ
jgi:hypothetical protein